jgi:hypothetical protein
MLFARDNLLNYTNMETVFIAGALALGVIVTASFLPRLFRRFKIY